MRYPYSATNDGTKAQIGSGPVDVFQFFCLNNDSSARYVQFFNAAPATVTVGTTTPTFVLPVPASGGVSTDVPMKFFSTACTYAVTTTRTGATGPTAAADVAALY